MVRLSILWSIFITLLMYYPQNALGEKLNTSSVTSSSSLIMNDQESCCGQCALQLINDLTKNIGERETTNLINLNYNNFLFAMSNSTLFKNFCKEFYQFEHCCSMCTPSYSREILIGYSEIIDHLCVQNFNEIKENFGCLARINSQIRQHCINLCTPYQQAFHSIVRNFRHFILNNNATVFEDYLNESCEYVLCSLHCDVPLIKHNCGYGIVEKIIALTRNSFKSMKKISLDTAVINRWPKTCAEIITYRIPERNLTVMKENKFTATIEPKQNKQVETNGQESQQTISFFLILIIYFVFQ